MLGFKCAWEVFPLSILGYIGLPTASANVFSKGYTFELAGPNMLGGDGIKAVL